MSNNEHDDEKGATVIQWPGPRAAATPPAPEPIAPAPEPIRAAPAAEGAPPAGSDATDGRTPDAAAEDAMTLDAFEAAIRRAVHEKLGPGADVPQFPPRGADDLVAKVFSVLSGEDPKAALAAVRDQLSAASGAGADGGEGGSVIDLSAAREARKKVATETTSRVSGALKESFNEFLANLSASQGQRTEIVLDSQFLKEHGPALLGNLFQGLAAALLQGPKAAAPASTPPSAPAATPATAAPSADEAAQTPPPATATPKEPVQVNVKVDFANILSSLFRRKPTAPAPAPEAAPAASPPPGSDPGTEPERPQT